MSTKVQHTPGPWIVRRFPFAGKTYVTDTTPDGARGDFRGQIISTTTTAPESAQNMRLIAAAPELLAALKDTIATLAALSAKHKDGMDNLVGTTLYNSRAAIAKAEAVA